MSDVAPQPGTPRVTVLMPVYNGAAYLAESMDSVLAQTFGDYEFLAINDGSRDGSLAILQEYAARDARLRVIDQANMGLAATLNKGLSLARGALVARQDQDDLCAPDRLQKQVAWMDAHPDCTLLGTHASILADRTPTDRAHEHPTEHAVLRLDLLFNNPFVHSSVMLRRDAVLAIGGYTTDRERQPPEDYELWSRMARAGRVANLPERLLAYREAPQSMSRTGFNPFQSKLVKLCAENLAFAAGLPEPDVHCRDIAALIHQAPTARSAQPDLAAMESVLQRCCDRIATEITTRHERSAFEARRKFWFAALRHHAQHQAVGWAFAIAPSPKYEGPVAEQPEVTVLMPVYNGAADVARAIDSIRAQTFRDFEFLIVNDGSTDGTQQVLESYAALDARIRIVQQANQGLAAALNTGLSHARGTFVARQDHDDLSAPQRLERQLAWMREHPDCALLGTRAAIWTGNDPGDRAHDHPEFNAVLQLDLLVDNPFVHSSVMLRREAVLALGGYTTDPARQPPEDYELWARIARVHPVANLPERLLVYREMPASMSRTGEHPFRARLVHLSAEQLAWAAGLPADDRDCRDLAALFHPVPGVRSRWPSLSRMQSVLQRCFDRLSKQVRSPQERVAFEQRCDFWRAALRHQYLRQVWQPAWAYRITTAGARKTRAVLRKMRAVARKVVG